MNKSPTERANELYHHGIKGQKWGVRRFQNPDGTLTALGKTRYYTDDDSKAAYEKAKSQIKIRPTITTSGRKVGGRTIDSDEINEAGKFLKGQSDALTDEFNSICDKTVAHYKSLNTNQKFRKEMLSILKKELVAGDRVGDYDIVDYTVEDHIESVGNKYMSTDLKKSWNNFKTGVDTYYNNVKSITTDIVGKCGDMTIDTARKGWFDKTEYKYADVVEHSLHELGSSTWVRYLNNHTEMAYLDGPGYDARQEVIYSIVDDFMETKSK